MKTLFNQIYKNMIKTHHCDNFQPFRIIYSCVLSLTLMSYDTCSQHGASSQHSQWSKVDLAYARFIDNRKDNSRPWNMDTSEDELHIAAKNDDVYNWREMITRIAQDKKDPNHKYHLNPEFPNAKNKEGFTPLGLIIARNDELKLNELRRIEKWIAWDKAYCNPETLEWKPTLLHAIESEVSSSFLKTLLSKPGVKKSQADKKGRTPLLAAIHQRNQALAATLLDKWDEDQKQNQALASSSLDGSDEDQLNIDIEGRTHRADWSINEALKYLDDEFCCRLVHALEQAYSKKNPADAAAFIQFDHQGRSPLDIAIQEKKPKAAEALVEWYNKGAINLKNRLTRKDKDGCSPLHHVVIKITDPKPLINMLCKNLSSEDFFKLVLHKDKKGNDVIDKAAYGGSLLIQGAGIVMRHHHDVMTKLHDYTALHAIFDIAYEHHKSCKSNERDLFFKKMKNLKNINFNFDLDKLGGAS